MRRAYRSLVPSVLAFLIAIPGLASVLAPPSNLGDLARVSRTVVFAEARGSRSELRGQTPYTVTTFQILQQVAGAPVGRSFEVVEAGGVAGGIGMVVSGAPVFERGGRYLLFLDPSASGGWQTKMLAYGILRDEGGVLRPIPQAAGLQLIPRPGIEPVGAYSRDELLQHLSAVATGAAPWHGKAVIAGESLASKAAVPGESLAQSQSPDGATAVGVAGGAFTSPPVCRYVRNSDGIPLRWFGFEAGASAPIWHTTPGQTGIADGGVSAVQEGIAAWTGHKSSVINFTYAGSKPTTVSCATGDGRARNNEVVFNDPCNQIPDLAVCTGTPPAGWSSPCCGQVAVYGTFFNPTTTQPYDGAQWWPANNLSIIVNNGSQCLGDSDFKEMLTHFIGHGAAFDHHEDSDATMYGQFGVHPSRGATIAQSDKICAAALYHTFADVSFDRWSWKFVEAFEDARIDQQGCGGGNFCPTALVNRGKLAVYIIRGSRGPDFVPPPATGTLFADVPASHPDAAYIEQLYNDGLTGGCGTNPLRYCPSNNVSRAEMATFLLRISHGPSYTPPPASGTTFQDAPANYWATPYIEQLFRDGGTAGCSSNPPRYCPEDLVQKEQVATFLDRVFVLPLPAEQ
ncbi:MAG TPA: S-layer homology domain-containing protein [Thermoanaerobaculia bacterium]|jgi:hypothetical protein|nr:S-layer homology domain-containing protein [Thermoanaerobaculia bacterium]